MASAPHVYLLALSVTVSASGCAAAPPPICTPNGAYQAGRAQGAAGRPLDVSAGARCSADSGFRGSFESGHTDGLGQFCRPDTAAAAGRAFGARGQRTGFPHERYGLCGADLSALERGFEAGNASGLADYCRGDDAIAAWRAAGLAGDAHGPDLGHYAVCDAAAQTSIRDRAHRAHRDAIAGFCSGDQAIQNAHAAGSRGEPRPSLERFRVCGPQPFSALSQRSEQAYVDGLNRYCAGTDIDARGESDGLNGVSPASVQTAYAACSVDQQRYLKSRYRESYNRGFRALCNAALTRVAHDEATEGTRPPDSLETCFRQFPGMAADYAEAVRQAREPVIQAQCTYDNGQHQAHEDAKTHDLPQTAQPSYCDAARFRAYLAGYLDAWRGDREAACSGREGYRLGHSDGLAGRARNPVAPPACTSILARRYERRYERGYRNGVAERPKVTAIVGLRLRNRTRAQCLGVDNRGTRRSNAQVARCRRHAAQVWTLTAPGTLQTADGDCLHVPRSGNGDRNVIVGRCNGRDNQRWRIEPGHDGHFELRSARTGLCLDIDADAPGSRANASALRCAGDPTQQWLFADESATAPRLLLKRALRLLAQPR